MTGTVLQSTGFSVIIKSLVQYNKTFGSSYDASFHEEQVSHISKESVSCRILQAAVEVTHRRYYSVTRVRRRYPEGPQLVEKVKDEATASESTAGKGRLGITLLRSVLFSRSEKQDFLLFIKVAAAHTKHDTKEKRAAVPSPHAFNPFAAALLEKLKIIHKKAFSASKSKVEEFLSAQLPRTESSSLSVKAILLHTISLFSHAASDKRKTRTARVTGRS